MAVKEEKIEVEGEVVEALPSTVFRALSAYDLSRGRITYRYR
jgi:translation initiation factor IF-1